MNPFIAYLKQYYHISVEAQQALEEEISFQQFEKDEFLHKEGMVCRKLYFIEQGSVRGFHYNDGREVTNWFGLESNLVTSFHSFIDQQPGYEYIQTMEDSLIWSIGRETLYALYDQFPAIERLGRITCEQYYIRLEDRYVNAHFKTATERYQNLLQIHPQITQRVPLGFIASYLGISQETLSRIRSKPI
ncbi:MAG: Crp/Fnr family transcriptional regulator [Bacteroidota bacterium]